MEVAVHPGCTHMQPPRLVHTTSTRIPKVHFACLLEKDTHKQNQNAAARDEIVLSWLHMVLYFFSQKTALCWTSGSKIMPSIFLFKSSTSDCLSLTLGMHICIQVHMSAMKRTTLCQNTVAGAAAGQLNDCPCPTLPDSNTASKSTSHGVMAVGYCLFSQVAMTIHWPPSPASMNFASARHFKLYGQILEQYVGCQDARFLETSLAWSNCK